MIPEVTLVCLYADRPRFIPTMLESFRSQTYARKWLLIYDNGHEPFEADLRDDEVVIRRENVQGVGIGALRNIANEATSSPIIAHLDVDDWSHPNRITEQVALLQQEDCECVGYSDLVFWQAQQQAAWIFEAPHETQPPGTSLMYWRKTWERMPFPEIARREDGRMGEGEDAAWLKGRYGQRVLGDPVDVVTVSSVLAGGESYIVPRIIASIHGGNTCPYDPERFAADPHSKQWRRAPQLDAYCAERFR